ncbi:hypothetical protein ACLMJK_000632 [Lecanora helva]
MHMAQAQTPDSPPEPALRFRTTTNIWKPIGCPGCNRAFATIADLAQHQNGVHWGHLKPYMCQKCIRDFATREGIRQHLKASHLRDAPYKSWMPFDVYNHWTCWTCKSAFYSLEDLQGHKRFEGHCYCNNCQMYFDDPPSLKAHNDKSHPLHFHCCDCLRDFVNEYALNQHLQHKVHEQFQCQVCQQILGGMEAFDRHIVKAHGAIANQKRKFYPPELNSCYICQRSFKNKMALEQHLKSVVHHPLSNLKCIVSSKCKARFTTPSALLNHLESGHCRSGLSRQDIHRLVQIHDTERMITHGPSAQRMIDVEGGGSDFSSSSGGTPIMTPTSSMSNCPSPNDNNFSHSPLPTDNTFFGDILSRLERVTAFREGSLTAESISGFQIPLPKLHHSGHTNPPTGQMTMTQISKPFHCPIGISRSTQSSPKYFSTLGGLAQHIESGACGDGAETMRKSIGLVQEKLEERGFQGLRLLK